MSYRSRKRTKKIDEEKNAHEHQCKIGNVVDARYTSANCVAVGAAAVSLWVSCIDSLFPVGCRIYRYMRSDKSPVRCLAFVHSSHTVRYSLLFVSITFWPSFISTCATRKAIKYEIFNRARTHTHPIYIHHGDWGLERERERYGWNGSHESATFNFQFRFFPFKDRH